MFPDHSFFGRDLYRFSNLAAPHFIDLGNTIIQESRMTCPNMGLHNKSLKYGQKNHTENTEIIHGCEVMS
jgi:hypothetical protein